MSLTRSEAFKLIINNIQDEKSHDKRISVLRKLYKQISSLYDNMDIFSQNMKATVVINYNYDFSILPIPQRQPFKDFIFKMNNLVDEMSSPLSISQHQRLEKIKKINIPDDIITYIKKYDYYIYGIYKDLVQKEFIWSIINFLSDSFTTISNLTKLIIWNSVTDKQNILETNKNISTFCIIEDKILLGFYDGSIELWNINGLIIKISAHTHSINKISFVSDELFASTSYDGTIELWDINTYKNIFTLETKYPRIDVIVPFKAADDIFYIVGYSYSGYLQIWNINIKTPIFISPTEEEIANIHFIHALDELITISYHGIIKSWKFKIREYIVKSSIIEDKDNRFEDIVFVHKSILDPTKNKIIILLTSGDIKIYDALKDKIEKTLLSEEKSIDDNFNYSINFLPNHQLMYSSKNGIITIWDLDNYTIVKTLNNNSMRDLITLPNGKIVILTEENLIRIWS